MKYTIRSKGIEITDAMKDKTINVFSKLDKYTNIIGNDNTFQIEITYTKEKQAIIRATLNIVRNNVVFKCKASDSDFYRALDKAEKEIRSQILKLKDRQVSMNKHKVGPHEADRNETDNTE